jgi:purine-binding chemotaxis protein CheW
MDRSNYLLFSLNSARYGLPADAVREIFWLPELSQIEEAPAYIIGVVNLHGRILPVMSLDERFRHPLPPLRLSDWIVVLQFDEIKIGILVNEVHDIAGIPASEIEPVPRFSRHIAEAHFIAGEAKVKDHVWMLLDLPNLIDAPEFADKTDQDRNCTELFLQLPAAEREIFRSRARQLAGDRDTEAPALQEVFVAIQLEEEYYAVAMSDVREFCYLNQFTPIPCCPAHIMGNMNLRGDILTLVDIRPVLSIASKGTLAEVMVVECEDLRLGIPITRVLDVVYLSPGEYRPLSAHNGGHDYCTGAIQTQGRIAVMLDMKALLTQGGLEVNEEI